MKLKLLSISKIAGEGTRGIPLSARNPAHDNRAAPDVEPPPRETHGCLAWRGLPGPGGPSRERRWSGHRGEPGSCCSSSQTMWAWHPRGSSAGGGGQCWSGRFPACPGRHCCWGSCWSPSIFGGEGGREGGRISTSKIARMQHSHDCA